MSRVLVLVGASSYRARAFLEAAATLELSLTIAGDRESVFEATNPEGLLSLDFADRDAAVRVARDHHARHPLSAVIATDDDGVIAAAAIAAALGLAGSPVAAVERARDKRRMREALAAAALPAPWFEIWPVAADPVRIARDTRYPCVLKPPALSASRGVIRADTESQFVAAFRRVAFVLADAGNTGGDAEILVEEYLEGDEIAVEGLLTAGALRGLAIFDKPDPLIGPTFEETLYVTPSRLAPETQAAAVRTVAAMVTALGLTHGAVHAELRVNARGIWPIEIAPRSIGGLCSRVLRFGDGDSLEALLLRHALGQAVDDWIREPAASGVMMIPIPRAGILHEVCGIEQARAVPGIDDVRITIPTGQLVMPLPEGNRYLGFLFAHGPEPGAVESALRRAHERLSFEIHTE